VGGGGILVHVLSGAASDSSLPHNVHGIEAARQHGGKARMLQPRQRYCFRHEITLVAQGHGLVQEHFHDAAVHAVAAGDSVHFCVRPDA
jgi:hypothetical protein